MREIPSATPGPDLAALRQPTGVTQEQLARRLGVHRVTVANWEAAPAVKAITAARYRKALADIVREAVA